jgi:hypothetical protein
MSFTEFWKAVSLPDANFTTEQIAALRKIALAAYNRGKKDGCSNGKN